MKIHKSEIAVFFIVLASFGLGLYVYPFLPERVASHWNMAGEVNGYVSRFWGAFLMPLVSLALYVFFLIFPRIDPKRKNIEKFRGHFDVFIILIFLFLFYINGLTLIWNFGYRFNMIQLMAPAFGILFYDVGILVKNAQPNWSIGIRTPWTLSSPAVWKKTHEIGGRLFMYCGLLAALGSLAPVYAIWLILIPVLFTAIYTVVYSYLEFRKVQKK